MFDGLKDKLDTFRSDVDESLDSSASQATESSGEAAEATEEAAEPVDDEAEDTAAADSAAETDGEEEASAGADDSETAEADEDNLEETSSEDNDFEHADSDDGKSENSDSSDGDSEDQGSGASFTDKLGSAVRGRVVIEADDLEGPLWDLEMALLESDVEMGVAEAILDQIEDDLVGEERKFTESTAGIIEEALRDALLSVMSVGQFDFDQRIRDADKPVVIVFTGVNGVGKTTSIAKLSKYLEDRGISSVMANGDTYRAGANEQIEEHAANRDTKLISHEMGGDPAAVIYDAVEYAQAHDIDVVLGDTAGRLHTSNDLMEQLAKIHRVVDPDMTLFVDEAVAGQDAVNRAREFNDAAEIDGTILTMADADSQGGAAISIAHVTGKPILFLGTGQGYDDLQRFDPDELVDDLLGE